MAESTEIATATTGMTAGTPWPVGVHWIEAENAFNFALYSRHATGVTLLCYTDADPVRPIVEFRLQHPAHKTGNIWHCRLAASSLFGATLYAYRVEGPYEPDRGHRFDPQKVLLDPYAPSVFFPPAFSRKACVEARATDGHAPLGRLPGKHTATSPIDAVPRHTCNEVIIYELHVKGFTARANSGVTPSLRGTFAGLIEKIPYMKELGVTVVELLPVHQFDPQEGNYWGYMTLHFFSPHQHTRTARLSQNSRQWCRRFTRPASRCGSTWFTTTPAEGGRNRADLQLSRHR